MVQPCAACSLLNRTTTLRLPVPDSSIGAPGLAPAVEAAQVYKNSLPASQGCRAAPSQPSGQMCSTIRCSADEAATAKVAAQQQHAQREQGRDDRAWPGFIANCGFQCQCTAN